MGLIVFFSRMGIPREILSDQETNFVSQLLKEIYLLLNGYPIRTTPYHPQTDGLVERFNRILKSMLKKVEVGTLYCCTYCLLTKRCRRLQQVFHLLSWCLEEKFEDLLIFSRKSGKQAKRLV